MYKTLDVIGIGTMRSHTNDNVEFDTLDTYTNIAKRMISKYAPKYLKNEMLNDDDIISYIAYAIMIADWRYDGRGHKSGFRSKMAQFAIRSYQTRRAKSRAKNNGMILSLFSQFDNDTENDQNLCSSIVDKSPKPDDIVERKEILSRINALIANGSLSEKQAKCFRLYYYEGNSMKDIADDIGITRQWVHKCLAEGVEIIKEDPVLRRIITERDS